MVIFDAKGKFVRSWGKDFMGGAHGLHIHKEGKDEFLYLCDTKRSIVVKTTTKGEEVFTLGYPKESDAYKPKDGKLPVYRPTNLAIAANGDIYVGDGYGSSYVNQYNKRARFIGLSGVARRRRRGRPEHASRHRHLRPARQARTLLVADPFPAAGCGQAFALDGSTTASSKGPSSPHPLRSVQERRSAGSGPGCARHAHRQKNNPKVILHLGEDTSGKEREVRKMSRDHFTPGKFVCPHGRLLRPQGQYFCRGVGGSRTRPASCARWKSATYFPLSRL
jgi:hypothetical protein